MLYNVTKKENDRKFLRVLYPISSTEFKSLLIKILNNEFEIYLCEVDHIFLITFAVKKNFLI